MPRTASLASKASQLECAALGKDVTAFMLEQFEEKQVGKGGGASSGAPTAVQETEALKAELAKLKADYRKLAQIDSQVNQPANEPEKEDEEEEEEEEDDDMIDEVEPAPVSSQKVTAQFFTHESADEGDFDLLTCDRIRVLQDGEKRAVENEDYDEAERCMQKLSRLKSVGHSIAQLEEEKRLAVSNKAYAQAKAIKAEVDRLRKYAEEGPLPDAPVLGGEHGAECSAERAVTEWRLQAPSSQIAGYHVDTAWTGVLQPQHVPWSLASTASTVEVQHNAHLAGTCYDLAGHACYSQDWSLPYFASGPHPDLTVEDAHPALRQSQVPAQTAPGSLPAKRELGTVRMVSDRRNNRGVPQFAILWTQSGELRVQRRSIAQFAASGPRGAPYRMAAGMEVSFSRMTSKDGTSHAVDVRLASHD